MKTCLVAICHLFKMAGVISIQNYKYSAIQIAAALPSKNIYSFGWRRFSIHKRILSCFVTQFCHLFENNNRAIYSPLFKNYFSLIGWSNSWHPLFKNFLQWFKWWALCDQMFPQPFKHLASSTQNFSLAIQVAGIIHLKFFQKFKCLASVLQNIFFTI